MQPGKTVVPAATLAAGSSTPITEFSEQQVEKLADMIAEGRTEFPADLGSEARSRVECAVRRRLEGRLLTLIAKAIAQDLIRGDAGKEPI
jgi:hypothetical protein